LSTEYGFGIDLGTTNSAIARSNGIEVRTYQNNDQMNVTPSAVRVFKGGRLIVGKRAYGAIIDDPENIATEFKRSMGQKVSKTFPASGQGMSPEELSAEVLKSLKDDVRRQTGEDIRQAVITVPAAFGTPQCESTSRAAALAGVPEAYLLQEPIAASIAYGVLPEAWDQNWLVFDLGGGTLDVAVVSTRDGRLTVLEQQGNNLLGGKDMDRRLVENVFLPALRSEFALPETSSPEGLRLLRRLLLRAEEAKIDLTNTDSVVVSIADVGLDRRGVPIETEIAIRRGEFENQIDPLVRTCVRLTREALSGARLSGSDLDRVLLVGGPTQIPYLRAALVDGIGARIDSSIDPMTVVARGAAIYASSVDWAESATPSITGGKVNLTLAYSKVSSSLQEPVAGSVTPSGIVDAVKIDAEGGLWTSGWTRLAAGAFELPVRLIQGKLTRFFVYARRPDGSLVDLDPDSFSIRHGLVPSAPPLPFSVGIEVLTPNGKPEVDFIFPKGHPLPLTRVINYRAAHELRRSQPDDFLAIKVWEGETKEDPDANLFVGAMTILSRHLRRAIPEGAEIRLTFHIDESRKISVDVLLPHSNESFSEDVYLPDREQQDPAEQVQKLPHTIESILDRLDAVDSALASHNDPEVGLEARQLRSDLEELDIELSGSESSDPDFANHLLERMRALRRRLVVLENQTLSPATVSAANIDRVKQQAAPAKEVTGKFGSESEKHELATLMRELEQAGNHGDTRSANRVGEHLESLRWRVLFNQSWFWKEAMEVQQQTGRKFINQQEAGKWLEAGEEAVRRGDSLSLQEAVKHLWRLQPKSDADIDKDRAMNAGLRKY